MAAAAFIVSSPSALAMFHIEFGSHLRDVLFLN
jgi:hypothetical protein